MVIVNPAGNSNIGTVFGSKAIDWSKYETLNADFEYKLHTNYAQFYLYTTDEVKKQLSIGFICRFNALCRC